MVSAAGFRADVLRKSVHVMRMLSPKFAYATLRHGLCCRTQPALPPASARDRTRNQQGGDRSPPRLPVSTARSFVSPLRRSRLLPATASPRLALRAGVSAAGSAPSPHLSLSL